MTKYEEEEYWQRRYRKLYWELNELQLILPDSPAPITINQMIADCESNMGECIKNLGYVPSA